jgi:hypothetical protein
MNVVIYGGKECLVDRVHQSMVELVDRQTGELIIAPRDVVAKLEHRKIILPPIIGFNPLVERPVGWIDELRMLRHQDGSHYKPKKTRASSPRKKKSVDLLAELDKALQIRGK